MNTVRLPGILRALRHRNYRLFFFGQSISLTGTWMQAVAQSWLVYRLTGSAVLLGAVNFARLLPVFLLSPIGGVAADHYSRLRIVVATQVSAMVLAFMLAAVTLSGVVTVWQVVVLAALLGVANAFEVPARQAFVVDMVGRDDLVNAIALNSSMINGSRIIGPSIAGVLVAAIGEGWCFFVNAASFVPVIAALLMMRVPSARPAAPRGSAIASIVEGFRFVAHTRPIRALLLLLGLVSIMGMPYAVLMPIFAEDILHGGARGLGLLMGATGCGALVAAAHLASRKGIQGLGRWVMISAAGFGASLMLFSFSRSFWLSAALLLPTGFCMMTQMASSNTLLQSLAPDHLRGRVMAVYSMMFMGMAPFGSLLAGTLAHHIGAPATVALGGAACIAAAALFGAHLPALRDEAREMIVALQTASGAPGDQDTSQATGVAEDGS